MRLKMIINPVSGHIKARNIIADVIDHLKRKHALKDKDIFFTSLSSKPIEKSFFDQCDVIVVAGGDGTLHYAVNSIKQLGIDKPVAYLPTGTVNDFGNCLSLPYTAEKFCEMLEGARIKKIDLGLAGDEYFHYVVAGGAINTISYTTNQYLKNMFGEKAYYLSAVPKLAKIFQGTHIKIESDELHKEQEALLYLVTNSSVVGGHEGMVPGARMDDGHLHVLVIKKSSLFNTIQLLFDIKNGTHIGRSDVLYFKTKRLSITQFDLNAAHIGIDGEKRSSSIENIEIVPQGLAIIVPSKEIA
ncbi:diacylglycerol/lipid kinase family protein [Paenibacillus sp. BAC0078]